MHYGALDAKKNAAGIAPRRSPRVRL